MKTHRRFQKGTAIWLMSLTVLALVFGVAPQARAQKEMPEVTIATAVSNFAFAALRVAGGGSPCQTAVGGRSVNFCASSSEGLVLAKVEGAPLIAIQAHNRNLTLSVTVRKALAEKFKLTRKSPIAERMKVLTQLGPIGATSPGAVSEQIIKFLVGKVKGGHPEKLKFVYLGGPRFSNPKLLSDGVFERRSAMPARTLPVWWAVKPKGGQRLIDFSLGAG